MCLAQTRASQPLTHLPSFKAEKVEGRQEVSWMKIMPAWYRKQELHAEKEIYSLFPSAGRCQPLLAKWKKSFSMVGHAWENKWLAMNILPIPEIFCLA